MLNAVLILVFGLLVSACSQPQKKPFSNPRRYADLPAAAVPALSPGGSGPAAGWSQSLAERAISGYPRLRESVWRYARPPHGQHDHIAVHRIRAADPPADRPVFFFLPGAHHHGEVVVADERYDLRLYLAQRGIESWTLNYRTHFISREQIFDSDFMQGWTAQVFIEDAAAAADFVRHTSGVQKIFVGGYSRGASFAALMAARYSRQDVLGLALLDGYVLEPPEWRTIYRERKQTPAWFADDLERRYVPYRRWIKMLQETLAEPDGPDFMPVHLFENRAEMLKHFLFVSPTYGQQGGCPTPGAATPISWSWPGYFSTRTATGRGCRITAVSSSSGIWPMPGSTTPAPWPSSMFRSSPLPAAIWTKPALPGPDGLSIPPGQRRAAMFSTACSRIGAISTCCWARPRQSGSSHPWQSGYAGIRPTPPESTGHGFPTPPLTPGACTRPIAAVCLHVGVFPSTIPPGSQTTEQAFS